MMESSAATFIIGVEIVLVLFPTFSPQTMGFAGSNERHQSRTRVWQHRSPVGSSVVVKARQNAFKRYFIMFAGRVPYYR
jgi:hypothetical protein